MTEQMTSTKPYIVRAFYDWITDNQLTPYILVDTSVYGVIVPPSFVKDDQIVLNISPSAVGAISMVGEQIEFSARFGGKLEHLTVPYGAVAAIYAKENGAGTQLPVEHPEPEQEASLKTVESKTEQDSSASDKPKARPSLKVIK